MFKSEHFFCWHRLRRWLVCFPRCSDNLRTDKIRPVTRWAKTHLEHFLSSLEKCVGHSLKLLDTGQKIWAPLRKHFSPPGVPSWLQAWIEF